MSVEEQIAQLLVIQKVTTKNVDAIAVDIKELVKALPQLARIDEKYKSMDKRICKLENIVSWVARIIGGVLITSLLALVIIGKAP